MSLIQKLLFKAIKSYVSKYGFVVSPSQNIPADIKEEDVIELMLEMQQYTMTSPERIYGLIQAVKYISRQQISGSIVECGVWRGGSMMAAAKTLMMSDSHNRDLYLFDTYDGMTKPTTEDGSAAAAKFEETKRDEDSSDWCYASLEDVQKNLKMTGYSQGETHFVKGKVEDTIPENAPDNIALLRLDTDWYTSTLHELNHLYPRLAVGGVLIIDDYGRWQGARQAVDEYLAKNDVNIMLSRLDSTGRIGIKSNP